jgi:restriction system protein
MIDEQNGRKEEATSNEESVRRAVIARLNGMAGYEFEQLVARVLDGSGLRNSQVVGRSGDEGVDILADLHSPFVTAKVAVQVKRHAANIGPRDISYLRDRWSRRADRLLFVTTSDFTPGAREVADDEHDKQVVLINGSQLVRIMFEHNLGVRQRPVVLYEMEEEFFSG